MKNTTLGWMAALSIAGCVLGFGACTQPRTECQVGLASTGYNYAVKYKLKGTPAAGCEGLVLPGEQFGMEFYHPPTADKSTYNSDKTSFAVKSDALGNLINYYAGFGGGDPCMAYGASVCTKDADCGDPSLKCTGNYCIATSCTDLHTPWGAADFGSSTPDAKTDECSAPKISLSETDLPETIDNVGASDADGNTLDGAPCATDTDCQFLADPMDPTSGDPSSGAVCDTANGVCIIGCYGTVGGQPAPNGCVAPAACSSTDDKLGDCKLAATSIKYEWSNVDFYVTAAAPGTQFKGDLKYTQDGCTVEYEAVGIWPAIGCGSDADCNPCADPDAGITIGSGISPDFPTICDPDLGLCVLADAKNPKNAAESIPQLLSKSVDCGPVD